MMKLYKFRPLANDKDFNYAKEILETNKFWCSKFSELNDPMEGVFYCRKEDVDVIYSEKNKHKICSFSGKAAFEKPVMWGYYANGFKGMAIEIDIDKNYVEKINYVNDIPSLECSTDDNKIEKILTTKLKPWKNEAEYRFLIKSENNFHKIGEITRVYFGNSYGDVANSKNIIMKSVSLSKYINLKDELMKFAEGKNIKVDTVKVEGCKVKKTGSNLQPKTN